MTTLNQRQVRHAFRASVLPYIDQTDKQLVRQAFAEWVDACCRDGLISDRVAQRVTLK